MNEILMFLKNVSQEAWLSIVGLIIAWVIHNAFGKWIREVAKPYLERYKATQIMQALLVQAQAICQKLVYQHPEATWDDILKMIVDCLIKEFDISLEVAQRVAIQTLNQVKSQSKKSQKQNFNQVL